jgi:signal transduction histidine kinase
LDRQGSPGWPATLNSRTPIHFSGTRRCFQHLTARDVNEPSSNDATSAGVSTAGVDARLLELEAGRDIAQAFLSASRPLELYRLALARLTPLVGANFSSVFLRDPTDPELLKLECAQNWPQSSARFLSQMRIRVGRGPTGRSVEEGRAIEVPDVFADPTLREWWDPARELGFASMITLPLRQRSEVHGALSFYFNAPRQFDDAERRLISMITQQLAATAERAQMFEELRLSNDKLLRENESLTKRVGDAVQAERLKTEFLSNISHELRTPLTSILGHTFMLLHEQEGELAQPQKAAVGKIDRAAGALLRLINDLLELSQLTLGRTHLTYAPEEAVALTERAAEVVGSPPEGVDLRIVADGRVPLQTDGAKVQRILENLVSNAFKFTPKGHVTVKITRDEPTDPGRRPIVKWTVADTGIGISEANRAEIFDEFHQVDGSSTRLYGGTGLGLALSLRLAHLLGGDLTVSSREGEGSTFVVGVPDAR